MTQDDAETVDARERRRNMGLYVAALAQMHLERNFNNLTREVASRLCMSIDIQHGEVFASQNANARRMTDVENACRFIAAVWDTV
ncbi:hypothetical protein [Nitrospirillum amazonense]|nr:hypothetical protein [Nitrospirillum amazonense]